MTAVVQITSRMGTATRALRRDPFLFAQARSFTLNGVPPGWNADAACLGKDPDIFFPTTETGKAGFVNYRPAYDLCLSCPVQAECLAQAMIDEAGKWRFGVVGGLSPRERTDLAKKWRRADGVAS